MTEPLRIVRGEPTPEELAAVTALFAAVAAPAEKPAEQPRGRWNDPARGHRRYWRPGPGGWRSAR